MTADHCALMRGGFDSLKLALSRSFLVQRIVGMTVTPWFWLGLSRRWNTNRKKADPVECIGNPSGVVAALGVLRFGRDAFGLSHFLFTPHLSRVAGWCGVPLTIKINFTNTYHHRDFTKNLKCRKICS